MHKKLNKVILAIVVAGLLSGGIAIASAATEVRTVTTAQGTTVDVLSITGTVTAVSTRETTRGVFGRFRRGHVEAAIVDDADGKTYTLELGPGDAGTIAMKVGDKVTVEGTVSTHGSKNLVWVWTFTGTDGKTVTLRKDDGTPNIQTVTVEGEVTQVNRNAASGTDIRSAKVLDTITVKKSDGTAVTVVLGHAGDKITVSVGDKVKVTGFATPMSATMVMATEFTGADGKTVILRHLGRDPGDGGFRGPMTPAETVTVEGTVTAVSLNTVGDGTKATEPDRKPNTIAITTADGTGMTIVLRRGAQDISVKVGDTIRITGFKEPNRTNTVVATEFTGADGATINLRRGGMWRRWGQARGRRGPGNGTCPGGFTGTGS